MDQTTHEVPSGFVWPTVGHPGRVPLWALIPTPNQPRRFFDDAELCALAETMKPENKGQQREIITVRVLTPAEMMEYAPARYMIKSGERRWRASHLAGLVDVEIRVKQYESIADEKLDTYMLNEGRVGLSDIENAEAIADVMREFKLETQEQLAQLIGKDQFWVSQHLALLRLSPKVREFMSPQIKLHERLKRSVGVYLSRLSWDVQDALIDGMPKGRVSSRIQINWLEDQLRGTDQEPQSRELKPSTLRRVMGYFSDQVERRAQELSANKGIGSLFLNATATQCNEVLGRLKDARAQLDELVEKVEALHREADSAVKGSRLALQASALGPQARQVPKPAAAPTPKPTPAPKLEEVEDEEQEEEAIPIPVRPTKFKAEPFKEVQQKHNRRAPLSKELTVTYEHENGRMVTDKISLERYVELYNSSRLKHQVKKEPMPEYLPTVEEAMEEVAQLKRGR